MKRSQLDQVDIKKVSLSQKFNRTSNFILSGILINLSHQNSIIKSSGSPTNSVIFLWGSPAHFSSSFLQRHNTQPTKQPLAINVPNVQTTDTRRITPKSQPLLQLRKRTRSSPPPPIILHHLKPHLHINYPLTRFNDSRGSIITMSGFSYWVYATR